MTMIMNMPTARRVELRKSLAQIKQRRKAQLVLFDELTIPVKDNLKFIDEVLKNKKDFEVFIAHCKKVNNYLEKMGILV